MSFKLSSQTHMARSCFDVSFCCSLSKPYSLTGEFGYVNLFILRSESWKNVSDTKSKCISFSLRASYHEFHVWPALYEVANSRDSEDFFPRIFVLKIMEWRTTKLLLFIGLKICFMNPVFIVFTIKEFLLLKSNIQITAVNNAL